jgi:hypothetical protein
MYKTEELKNKILCGDALLELKKMTEKDIRDLLEVRYGRGYVSCAQVAPHSGAVSGYVDMVVMGIWPSTGYEVHGFEIKTSRSDFLRELRQPDKAIASHYVHRWWIVAPPECVKIQELPQDWGLLEVRHGKLRKIKEAPKGERQIPMHFIASIIRRIAKIDINIINQNGMKNKLNI